MSTLTGAALATAGPRAAATMSDAIRDRRRLRAMRVTAVVTMASLVVLAMLLANRHTTGEEIWGPVTAAGGVLVGVLSLAFLSRRGRNRVARFALYALWLAVAFFGFGGYNDHRLARPVDTITDQRERPPLAPLLFTVWGIAGAVALRSGSKEK